MPARVTRARHGAVASPHHLATQAGLATLKSGPLTVKVAPLQGGQMRSVLFDETIARVTGESVLARMWPLIQTATFVLRPAVEFGVWVDRLLHRLYALDEPNPDDPETLTEEIRTVLEAGERGRI